MLDDEGFEPRYIATSGVSVVSIPYNENNIHFWDTAGQEKIGGIRDEYYLQADGAIVFLDLSNKLNDVENWIKDFTRINPTKPVVIVGNKKDIARHAHASGVPNIPNVPYVDMSVKTGENIHQPLDVLLAMIQKTD
jgi:GTP-binding nuclear protein Ran